MPRPWADDGGIAWYQVVSLAESVQENVRMLWQGVPDDDSDAYLEYQADFTLADTHLSRLIRRAKVMAAREREAPGE